MSFTSVPSVKQGFLSKEDREYIQSNYETILDNIKVEELIISLHAAKLISAREKADLSVKAPSVKGQHIIDEIFLKATYVQLESISGLLKTSQTPSHLEIGKILQSVTISRPTGALKGHKSQGDVHSTDYPDSFPQGLGQKASSQNSLKAPVASEETAVFTDNSDSSDEMESNYSSASKSESTPNLLAKFKGLRASFKKAKKKVSWSSSPNVSSVPKLGHYGVKDGNNPVYGKSVCFIIANFTEDLLGYQKDVRDIAEFHKKYLKCDHVFSEKWGKRSLMDLTKEQFMDVLTAIQRYLKDAAKAGQVDRFFLYILSHGDEDGIMMCQEGSRMQEQGFCEEGKPIRVQMQDIIDMFTHDQVPLLKTFPKVIINQCCQGTEVLKAAGGPKSRDFPDGPENSVPWSPPKYKLAVGADVIVCDATSHRSMAWVGAQGSLFIGKYLKALEMYHKEEHFNDILVEVNNQISQHVKKGRNPSDQRIVPAAQMPRIHSQLTKKFFLACPGQKPKFY